MKGSKLSKKQYKMYSLRRIGALGNVKELSHVFEEINRLKESIMLKGIKEVVTSGQESPTQVSFQFV